MILGAGGAGMMCAIEAGKRGRRVVLLDHSAKIGGKILISGGGRCNFTNTGASAAQYVSENPHFCKSALSRFTPDDFIAMVREAGIAFHEKKLGQLFCDHSAQDLLDMLREHCERAGANFILDCKIETVSALPGGGFKIQTSQGEFQCASLVVATGGLSLPKLGASDFGLRIAKQFGLRVVDPVPALDGFVFSSDDQKALGGLAGLSVDTVTSAGKKDFRENILFTHTGLSGPAALQASLHWNKGEAITINFFPASDPLERFKEAKRAGEKAQMKTFLARFLPSRLADRLCDLHFTDERPLPMLSERVVTDFFERLHAYRLSPVGTVGYSKAEVTRGGVDTKELSSQTMEAKRVLGLYFIGEVVDVTGWLGGYNFQWAWSSGWAAGQVV